MYKARAQEILMKALVFRDTGEPKSVLQLAEMPTPRLAPGEALVRMLLSPIHPSDLHMLRGRYGYQPELPASPGIEGVGIVEAVGPGVQGPAVGTRVVFVHIWQTWREQIVSSGQTRAGSKRPGRSGRRHLLHESFDCMGIDEIKPQTQGGGLAPTDGSCI
jgi:NADPH:quinone reductase-like Zn-dependent oxidoreductase